MAKDRTCGPCRACCVVVSIPELVKPPGVPCRHLKAAVDPRGCCAIYDRRPKPCATFRCSYLNGLGHDATGRPDTLGVMLEAGNLEGWPGLHTIHMGGELWPRALDRCLIRLQQWLEPGALAIVTLTDGDVQLVTHDGPTMDAATLWMAHVAAKGVMAKLGDGPLQAFFPGR